MTPLQSLIAKDSPLTVAHAARTVGAAVISGVDLTPFRLERNAFRTASITLALVMLLRTHSGWTIALLEVSVGIAVGLAISALWPERLVR